MRIAEAKEIIKVTGGYRVSFERVSGSLLLGDHTPDRDEPPFATEDEAWEFAEKLAKATRGNFVNFSVIRATDFTPVPNYRARYIENR